LINPNTLIFKNSIPKLNTKRNTKIRRIFATLYLNTEIFYKSTPHTHVPHIPQREKTMAGKLIEK
jgi:hypothetical protein